MRKKFERITVGFSRDDRRAIRKVMRLRNLTCEADVIRSGTMAFVGQALAIEAAGDGGPLTNSAQPVRREAFEGMEPMSPQEEE